jgi:hypothetical protein
MCILALWAAVACKRRGYLTNGAVMVRPSIRSTLMLSSEKRTSLTRSPALSSEVVMPSLQKLWLILRSDGFNTPQFFRAETKIVCQVHRRKPKFGGLVIPIEMNMRRLSGFMTIEYRSGKGRILTQPGSLIELPAFPCRNQ